jgi:hypothetical protein
MGTPLAGRRDGRWSGGHPSTERGSAAPRLFVTKSSKRTQQQTKEETTNNEMNPNKICEPDES